jgi:hypothetical protein
MFYFYAASSSSSVEGIVEDILARTVEDMVEDILACREEDSNAAAGSKPA